MKYKNYYKILELNSSRASLEEIKASYKRLVFKYHPDRNKGDNGVEEKFKEIGEAYQTLKDPRLRKRYNFWYYAHFAQNGVNLSFATYKFKSIKDSEFVKIFIGECFEEETKVSEEIQNQKSLDEEIELKLSLEEAFKGAIKQINLNFEGDEPRNIKVRVPRGTSSDSKVILKGEGKKDPITNERGDLGIRINLLPSKKYSLDGINLLKTLTITPSEAVLGINKSIESIDGNYELSIPSGVQNGEVLTIKNAGFINKEGKRGDLLATLQIAIPKELTQSEKELYAKLRRLHS